MMNTAGSSKNATWMGWSSKTLRKQKAPKDGWLVGINGTKKAIDHAL